MKNISYVWLVPSQTTDWRSSLYCCPSLQRLRPSRPGKERLPTKYVAVWAVLCPDLFYRLKHSLRLQLQSPVSLPWSNVSVLSRKPRLFSILHFKSQPPDTQQLVELDWLDEILPRDPIISLYTCIIIIYLWLSTYYIVSVLTTD